MLLFLNLHPYNTKILKYHLNTLELKFGKLLQIYFFIAYDCTKIKSGLSLRNNRALQLKNFQIFNRAHLFDTK